MPASVSACFVGKTEFIAAADADFPYEQITFTEVGQNDPTTLVKRDGAYRPLEEDNDSTIRFKKIAADNHKYWQNRFSGHHQPVRSKSRKTTRALDTSTSFGRTSTIPSVGGPAEAMTRATAQAAADYLYWFLPALGLQFGIVAMASALRGAGNFRPGMVVQTTTVVINIVLAPVLIFGWGTGHPLGVSGAALATFVGVLVGVVWLAALFVPRTAYLRFEPGHLKPRLATWAGLMKIGLPAGAEFALTAVNLFIVYSVTKPFGAEAQAGYGIGSRVLQAAFMPVVAVAFAAAPIAGQNFAAGLGSRVKEVFRLAATMAAGVMALMMVLSFFAAEAMISIFSADPTVMRVGGEYLQIVCWSFVASGIIFVASSMFQAMGNTLPPLFASLSRLVVFAVPSYLLSKVDGFQLHWIWYLSAIAIVLQLAAILWLLQREFRVRLAQPRPQTAGETLTVVPDLL